MSADIPRHGEAGVTLVETLVAMALFALIGIAGFAIVDSVLRVQARTEDRLAALAALERAMRVMSLDLEQVTRGALTHDDTGLALTRRVAGADDVMVRYALAEGGLARRVIDPFGGARADQRLLEDVTALTWRFFSLDAGWIGMWPPEDGDAGLPVAVEAVLRLSPGRGLAGDLRRVAVLPGEAIP